MYDSTNPTLKQCLKSENRLNEQKVKPSNMPSDQSDTQCSDFYTECTHGESDRNGSTTYELRQKISYNVVYSTDKGSDQPAQMHI